MSGQESPGGVLPGIDVVSGHVRVECRVVVWMTCPACGREHTRVLGIRDHPRLTGPRFWRETRHGRSYVVQVSAGAMLNARALAERISAEFSLNTSWTN